MPTGVIVERRYDRDGQLTLSGILSLDARVMRVWCLENEPADDNDDALGPHHPDEPKIISYIIGYTHPVSGEPVTLRVAGDRAKVWDAIRKTGIQRAILTQRLPWPAHIFLITPGQRQAGTMRSETNPWSHLLMAWGVAVLVRLPVIQN